MPKIPDPPSLSKDAMDRVHAVQFSQTHGVRLACEAYRVSRSTLYAWRKRYNPYRLETMEDRSRAPKKRRQVSWT